MGRAFDYVKYQVVNFKLNLCCWCAPVKIGLLFIGYLNIILSVISLLALSDDSFTPILMQVQDPILGDFAKKPIPVIAYCSELSFNVIMLSAIYRLPAMELLTGFLQISYILNPAMPFAIVKQDIPLLRLYQRYCIVALVASIMVYSMVVAAIGIIVGMYLVISIVVQIYVIILVRSMIVEIKLEKKNMELPTLVMSSTIPETKEFKVVSDVEAPSDSDSSDDDDKSVIEKKDRLETVDEHPKEESTTEEAKK